MMMVDSSVWIDHFNGTINRPVEFLRAGLAQNIQEFVIGDLILLEVLRGFRNDRDYLDAYNALQVLGCFDLVGKHLAVIAAQNYRILRKQGITIRKSADVLIATFCIEQQIPLLHNDRDFEPFAQYLGLQRAKM
ncbi:MAG: PIN domain nuclease [Methylococcales bacterium]|nr:PIN domain nuclease [Methylococcales bacterium]